MRLATMSPISSSRSSRVRIHTTFNRRPAPLPGAGLLFPGFQDSLNSPPPGPRVKRASSKAGEREDGSGRSQWNAGMRQAPGSSPERFRIASVKTISTRSRSIRAVPDKTENPNLTPYLGVGSMVPTTYRRMSPKHLQRYVSKFAGRHSLRSYFGHLRSDGGSGSRDGRQSSELSAVSRMVHKFETLGNGEAANETRPIQPGEIIHGRNTI